MYQLSDEHREELTKLHLKAYQKAIDLAPAVLEVLKQFDGKQVNKRIDTALKAIDNGLSFNAEYNSVIVKWFIDDRYRCFNKGFATYLEDYNITLAHGCAQSGSNPAESCIIDGRLNAAALIENLKAYQDEHTKTISGTLAQLPQVQKLKTQQAKIKSDIETYNNGLQWLIKRYFELGIKQY